MPNAAALSKKIINQKIAESQPLVKKQQQQLKSAEGTASEIEEELRRARDVLGLFVERTNPFKLEAWQHIVCNRLQRLRYEKGQRIAIHGPPQLGKSVIVSGRFPAWMLGNDPTCRVRVVCYNMGHAAKYSDTVQEVMRSPEYRAIFPDSETRIPKKCRRDEWYTIARKRLLDGQASFMPMGLDSGFTGTGVDLLIIDDPYKSRKEAYSDTINNSVWDWWRTSARARLNPDTNIVVMFHRWKEDDLAGRLFAEEPDGWEKLRFPALADDGEDDPTMRLKGESLSPRYPVSYYKDIEKSDPFTFLSLYQGTPIAEGGNMCKLDWLPLVDIAPVEGMTYVRYWDKAGTQDGGKFTAGVLMGKSERGIYYILDVVRGQWGAVSREQIIKDTCQLDNDRYGFVQTWIEQEPGSGGKESAENTIRNLAGYAIQAENVSQSGDKAFRFVPFCSQAMAGNVRVCRLSRDGSPNHWVQDYRAELCKFPAGAFKDQIDSTGGALNKLVNAGEWWAA